MPDVDLNDAPTVSAAAVTGHIVVVSGSEFRRVAVSELATAASLAATAVQPQQLGALASLDVAELNDLIDQRVDALGTNLLSILGPE